jgi:hypothetical protein
LRLWFSIDDATDSGIVVVIEPLHEAVVTGA